MTLAAPPPLRDRPTETLTAAAVEAASKILAGAGVDARIVLLSDGREHPPHVAAYIGYERSESGSTKYLHYHIEDIDRIYRNVALAKLASAECDPRTPEWVVRRMQADRYKYIDRCARVLRSQDRARGFRW